VRLRFGLGMLLSITGGVVFAGGLWRLIDPQSCAQHARLCVTASSTPTALTIQIYMALLGMAAAIALMIEGRTGRRQDGRIWGALTLIPSGIADLVFNWQAMGHDAKMTQMAKAAGLNPTTDAIFDIMMILLGVYLAIRYQQDKKKHRDNGHNPNR
jgi:hypothetical protein